MFNQFSPEERQQIGYLQECCNRYGDFLVSTHRQDGNWTKHSSVLWCWENIEKEAWRLARANNRTLFSNEVVLDFDLGKQETSEALLERVKAATKTLREKGIRFKVYFTGSKGYHIHIISYEINGVPKSFYLWFIKHFGGDTMIANKNHMIALENAPHWKTGNKKEEVNI